MNIDKKDNIKKTSHRNLSYDIINYQINKHNNKIKKNHLNGNSIEKSNKSNGLISNDISIPDYDIDINLLKDFYNKHHSSICLLEERYNALLGFQQTNVQKGENVNKYLKLISDKDIVYSVGVLSEITNIVNNTERINRSNQSFCINTKEKSLFIELDDEEEKVENKKKMSFIGILHSIGKVRKAKKTNSSSKQDFYRRINKMNHLSTNVLFNKGIELVKNLNYIELINSINRQSKYRKNDDFISSEMNGKSNETNGYLNGSTHQNQNGNERKSIFLEKVIEETEENKMKNYEKDNSLISSHEMSNLDFIHRYQKQRTNDRLINYIKSNTSNINSLEEKDKDNNLSIKRDFSNSQSLNKYQINTDSTVKHTSPKVSIDLNNTISDSDLNKESSNQVRVVNSNRRGVVKRSEEKEKEKEETEKISYFKKYRASINKGVINKSQNTVLNRVNEKFVFKEYDMMENMQIERQLLREIELLSKHKVELERKCQFINDQVNLLKKEVEAYKTEKELLFKELIKKEKEINENLVESLSSHMHVNMNSISTSHSNHTAQPSISTNKPSHIEKHTNQVISNISDKMLIKSNRKKLFLDFKKRTIKKMEDLTENTSTNDKLIIENREKLKEAELKLNSINDEIQSSKNSLLLYYHKTLSFGTDVRSDGLSWIIISIWKLESNVVMTYFPSYFDKENIIYMFLKSHIETIKNMLVDVLSTVKAYTNKQKQVYKHILNANLNKKIENFNKNSLPSIEASNGKPRKRHSLLNKLLNLNTIVNDDISKWDIYDITVDKVHNYFDNHKRVNMNKDIYSNSSLTINDAQIEEMIKLLINLVFIIEGILKRIEDVARKIKLKEINRLGEKYIRNCYLFYDNKGDIEMMLKGIFGCPYWRYAYDIINDKLEVFKGSLMKNKL